MQTFDPGYLCEYISKATAAMVRVYKGAEKLFTCSTISYDADPFQIYEEEFLRSNDSAGIITTALLQLFGYFTAHKKYRFVIGPSGVLPDDPKRLYELAFQLGISEERLPNFKRQLEYAPNIGIERYTWLLQLLTYLINNRKMPIERINLSSYDPLFMGRIAVEDVETMLFENENELLKSEQYRSFDYETQLWSLIKRGEPERTAEWVVRFPELHFGDMAQDSLRQIKNIGVCSAAIAARTAIEGGLDNSSAFRLSDIYIRKIELISDSNALMKLCMNMFIDYAERVRQAKLGLGTTSPLLNKCARYINMHLTQVIRVRDMADAFHMGRSYLCTKFKKETGISLNEFIRREKVMEAQQLLRHTSRSIHDISSYLAFSSQSHFHNTFKQFTGKTPGAYRAEIKQS